MEEKHVAHWPDGAGAERDRLKAAASNGDVAAAEVLSEVEEFLRIRRDANGDPLRIDEGRGADIVQIPLKNRGTVPSARLSHNYWLGFSPKFVGGHPDQLFIIFLQKLPDSIAYYYTTWTLGPFD